MQSPPRIERDSPQRAPYIVGVGGTVRADSATDQALHYALQCAAAAGARTLQFRGPDLDLPMYSYKGGERTCGARRLVEELRKADGIVLASPSYHGSVSGYVKNALDYAEDLGEDARPYFDGRAVGCIAVSGGWQGAVSTLNALRSIVHALRGWPTPLGVPIATANYGSAQERTLLKQKASQQIDIMSRQVVAFAMVRAAAVNAAA
jgi:FMN reductase